MSLHTLAKHVQQKGRGKDQMLVHMTPREVQGLQALAKAHGGSLTINPETGLPEAGFLEQVLPIVAMAAATYFTAGAAAPALSAALGSTMAGGVAAGTLAGAGVGAIGAGIQGKDVGQGALYGGLGGAISGGMGAYGDANVLSGAGEAAQTSTAVDVVNKGVSGQEMLNQTIAQSGDAGAGAGVSSYGEANALPNASQVNPSGIPTPPPTAAGNAAAAQSGQARIDALNKLDPSSYSFGNAPGVNAEQSMFQAENFTSPAKEGMAPGNIYQTIKPTDINTAGATPPSYYSTMSPIGKSLALAAPGIGADIGMNTPQTPIPTGDDTSSQATISPDFQGYTPPKPKPYQAQYTRYAAQGGLMSLAPGGPVERMSQNMMGGIGNMYPQSQQEHTNFATPTQMPASAEVIRSDYDAKTNPYTGVMMAMGGLAALAEGGDPAKKKKKLADLTPESKLGSYDPFNASLAMLNNARHQASLTNAVPSASAMNTLGGVPVAAGGGLASLGGYSDGGRLLKGPGDGMSDNIPAQIGAKQPARLADGEFVVPADVVSHLGNGSTDAGAKRLYSMMDKVRQARTGKKKQAPAVNTNKYLPA